MSSRFRKTVMNRCWLCFHLVILFVAAIKARADAPAPPQAPAAKRAVPHALPDLESVPADLVIPPLGEGAPAAGKRVRQTLPEYAGTKVYHVLYLPEDWKPGRRYPVIAEYAGNGNFHNKFGDVSRGWPEGSRLGYGASGGKGAIWICLPYVGGQGASRENVKIWWGDVAETVAYCKLAMRFVCREYGGNPQELILAGFSRGAIGCNFIGLHDAEIAKLWRGFIVHSHYDGIITTWPYAQCDRNSARQRLLRLEGRPQFISQEGGVEATRKYLRETGVAGDFTMVAIPYRNHSDAWVLRDIAQRRQLRQWLAKVLSGSPAGAK